MQVFLIRHPRPLIEAGVCYGRLDVDCEDPLPVAERLKSLLPEGVPVISSPLRRARRLAEALTGNPGIDERLAEIEKRLRQLAGRRNEEKRKDGSNG